MKNYKIYSKRNFETWPSWHLVYEWEEDLSSSLEIPIKSSEKIEALFNNRYVRKILTYRLGQIAINLLMKMLHQNEINIIFELAPQCQYTYSSLKSSIPLIIDFWNRDDLQSFYNTYKDCKLVCISSLEVYEFLVKNECPLNIKHLPLSISERYSIKSEERFHKNYQILFAGRRNEFLWSLMLKFETKFPDIEFLFQDEKDGKLFYRSNRREFIKEVHSRDEYISLLKESKIAFYSTPGMDGGEVRTMGFNPVTPRFLELLAAGCFVLGRYPNNEETRFYELDKYCFYVNSYEDFENKVLSYLKSESPDLSYYSGYLEKHYTSSVASQLTHYLKDL